MDNFCYLPIHLFPSKWDQTLIKVVKIKGTVMGLDTGILNFSQIMGPNAKKKILRKIKWVCASFSHTIKFHGGDRVGQSMWEHLIGVVLMTYSLLNVLCHLV